MALPLLLAFASIQEAPGAPGQKFTLWPGKPPGDIRELPPEVDTTKPGDDLVGGERVVRLGNVSEPTIEVFRPPADRSNGCAVVICPGGGFQILAYDLEGVEVAQWLNSLGVTAIVLKYRVPTRGADQQWLAPLQDTQRAISTVRARSEEWNIDPQKIGVCGFSAGGNTASYAALLGEQRKYDPIDVTDQAPCGANFGIIVYTIGFVPGEYDVQEEEIPQAGPESPPMFIAHAFDDNIAVQNSVNLFARLKSSNVNSELHVYANGGHGYGLRKTGAAVNRWPEDCARWLKESGWTTNE